MGLLNDLLFLAVGLFGVLGFQRGHTRWKGMRHRIPSPLALPTFHYETYGHPKAPVPTLHEALPPPPENMAWEIKTLVDTYSKDSGIDDTTTWLQCAMIDILAAEDTERIKSTKRVDLIWETRYRALPECNKTWAVEYRKYPRLMNNEFQTNIIDPFISWAQGHVDRYNQDHFGHGEYMIKGA